MRGAVRGFGWGDKRQAILEACGELWLPSLLTTAAEDRGLGLTVCGLHLFCERLSDLLEEGRPIAAGRCPV